MQTNALFVASLPHVIGLLRVNVFSDYYVCGVTGQL